MLLLKLRLDLSMFVLWKALKKCINQHVMPLKKIFNMHILALDIDKWLTAFNASIQNILAITFSLIVCDTFFFSAPNVQYVNKWLVPVWHHKWKSCICFMAINAGNRFDCAKIRVFERKMFGNHMKSHFRFFFVCPRMNVSCIFSPL